MPSGSREYATFEAAVEAILKIVIGICNCHNIDPDVRDDIAQEILLKTYRSWDQIENLHAYVAAAARNQISSHFRRLKSECWKRREKMAALPEVCSSQVSKHLVLEEAFDHISPRDRRLIILYFICGNTLKEIALLQRLSITTVWNRLQSAVRTLRKH